MFSLREIGATIRNMGSNCLQYSGLVDRYRRLRHSDSIAVLNYHHINSCRFRRHLDFLLYKCTILSMDECIDPLESNNNLPPDAVSLTFDDGYLWFYEDIYPFLKQNHIPATVFLTTNPIDSQELHWFDVVRLFVRYFEKTSIRIDSRDFCLGSKERREYADRPLLAYLKGIHESRRNEIISLLASFVAANMKEKDNPFRPLQWEQIKEMSNNGITFGAHTVTHPNLTDISQKKALQEVVSSRQRIEEMLQTQVDYFAYPNGEFNSDVLNCVKGAGFRAAFATLQGRCRSGDDLFVLKRIGIGETFSEGAVSLKLSGLWPSLGYF